MNADKFTYRFAPTGGLEFATMEDGEDWIMRPVVNHLCSYESLVEPGRLSLADIARMNEALDVETENRYRLRNNK